MAIIFKHCSGHSTITLNKDTLDHTKLTLFTAMWEGPWRTLLILRKGHFSYALDTHMYTNFQHKIYWKNENVLLINTGK